MVALHQKTSAAGQAKRLGGFALNVVCIVRNVIFYFQKDNSKAHTVSALLLAAAMVVIGILSWQGPVSLLIIAALAANTVFLSFGNPQLLRSP